MLIPNQYVTVKINKKTIDHYLKLGYDVKLKIIEVKVEDLHRNSYKDVKVKCDRCSCEKTVKYLSYIENYENGGYWSCVKCSAEKRNKTNLERYGSENVSGSPLIKEKKKQTNIKNWGTENVFQSDVIKEKSKETMLKNHGVEHALQNEELLEKSKETCLKNNGVEYPMQSKIVMDKSRETNLEKYGKEYYTQTEEYKNEVNKSNLEIYGSEWYMQSKDFKEKTIITNLEKYNVEYNMQNEKIHMKSQISGQKAKFHEKTGLFYRGSYEKDFLDFCVLNEIKVERGKRFSYFFEGKERYYFSDFYLKEINLIIEIKSKYYYMKYYDMNIVKKESVIKNGYDFLFIVDKVYNDFISLIKMGKKV